jgi:hypothetical protein
MIWPPIRYSYRTVNKEVPTAAALRTGVPVRLSREEACARAIRRRGGSELRWGGFNWLGTDDQARDVLARLIYGFRISVLFGLILTILRRSSASPAGRSRAISAAGPICSASASSRSGHRCRSLYLLLIISAFLCRASGPALHHAAVQWVALRRRGARRVPARAQFRVCARGARARRVEPHHVPPHAAERHGGDDHLPAVHPERLDHHADGARLPRLRVAAGIALARRADGAGQEQSQAPWLGFSGFLSFRSCCRC